ncbi:hypothetical protein LB553_21010 [Mesorhizobium sp. CA8]|uniref:hypothetical protein n=1 Tax=Mesorhizobium sp. CA8 TaxID=2876637 RepID=UPI001CCA2548|nr:hypothetical protein [Mesorhizobium sp. CA8]MBZ9763344.1 hypothetical protein [Mesorhizobium sp. CA8]
MSKSSLWAAVLHLDTEEALPGSVLRHIRDAIREGGYVSRGRITSGIKEAYRPLGIAEDTLRAVIDDAIGLLMRSGDIDELATGAGRGYAPTTPRRLVWGGADNVVLGAVELSSSDPIRRLPLDGRMDLIPTPLHVELGRPAWLDALVELGGADQPQDDAKALWEYARALANSGERYSLDEPQNLAVLSGSGAYFGTPDGPSGRWARAAGDGCFAAMISGGYRKRRVILAIENGKATVWEPPTRDIWHWIIVGITLSVGQPVWAINREAGTFEFLTPPPRQVERAALLTGEQVNAWSWRLDDQARGVIKRLLGSPRT